MAKAPGGYSGQGFSPRGEKGRYVLPPAFRNAIAPAAADARTLCLAKHDRWNCLTGFGLARTETFEMQAGREEDNAIRLGKEFDRELRLTQLWSFSEVPFDASGRFVLPDHLGELCDIGEGICFLGGGQFFTLWAPRQLYKMGPGLGRPAGGVPQARGRRQGQAQVTAPHIPVLLDEVMQVLAPQPGDVIVDATFGAGGYTRAILDAGATVHAFDRDPDAIAAGQAWPETAQDPPRLVLHPRRFSEMVSALAAAGVAQVDGVALDIGVSSMQLDQPGRGFAFSAEGPLDMTMSQAGPTAADFLNGAPEAEIADVLWRYGEERQSRRIARAIVAARPLTTTGDLANVVRKALGYHQGAPKDPATRSFQAVRIHVNGELDELEAGLAAAERLLKAGGRLAVVSFHSLEDRIVKQFLREAAGTTPGTSRHLPTKAAGPAPTFVQLSKAIRPSESEALRNPRARSATLRGAVRTSAPARKAA